jgi:SAM-dependent methyltransferase
MASLTASPALAAYEDLAPWYDRFTADHDYECWGAALEALAIGHGLRGRRLLDVCCGTGKSFEPFLRRGYDVVACDLSPAMVARAAEKTVEVDLHVADMRDLPVWGEFDLALSLADAVNYLLDPADLRQAFAGVARNLRAGGLFVFDLNTLATYSAVFAADRSIDDGELFFAWRGRGARDPAPGCRVEARIEAFAAAGDGRWQRSTSRHLQRHHPEPLVRAALAESGFSATWAYAQDAEGAILGPADERRHKTVYVARRAGKPSTQERR